MLNFLGLETNFSVVAGMQWVCQFLFRYDTTGEPANLDDLTFKGSVFYLDGNGKEKEGKIEFARSDLDAQRNVIRCDIPALPEGRWRYSIMATDDGGSNRRLLSGFVTVLGKIPDMNNGEYAQRTLILRLPNETGRKLQAEWSATTISEFFAKQSKQSAAESAASAKQSEASAKRSETAAQQSEASAKASAASAAEALKSQQAARQSELNAKDSEKQATSSATAAAKSAKDAAASAQVASSKADAASDSAARAKASETAAAKSEEKAAASQNAAKQSELEAKSAAENAKARAQDAANSADASAASAAESEASAQRSATSASESAASAAESAGSAQESAASAAESAQYASNSAASAGESAGSAEEAKNAAANAAKETGDYLEDRFEEKAQRAEAAAGRAAEETAQKLEEAFEEKAQRAETAAQNAAASAEQAEEIVGFDINDYTLKADFQAHVDDTAKHPTDARKAEWDAKAELFDLTEEVSEPLQSDITISNSEAGNGVARYVQIGDNDQFLQAPIENMEGSTLDVFELVSVSIKCRSNAFQGVGGQEYYLGVWEKDETDDPDSFRRIGTSTNKVEQVLGEVGTWTFSKTVINHRHLRFALLSSRDETWPAGNWHLMGITLLNKVAIFSDLTGIGATNGKFNTDYAPHVVLTYRQLIDRFSKNESKIADVANSLARFEDPPLIIGHEQDPTKANGSVWIYKESMSVDVGDGTQFPVVIGGNTTTINNPRTLSSVFAGKYLTLHQETGDADDVVIGGGGSNIYHTNEVGGIHVIGSGSPVENTKGMMGVTVVGKNSTLKDINGGGVFIGGYGARREKDAGASSQDRGVSILGEYGQHNGGYRGTVIGGYGLSFKSNEYGVIIGGENSHQDEEDILDNWGVQILGYNSSTKNNCAGVSILGYGGNYSSTKTTSDGVVITGQLSNFDSPRSGVHIVGQGSTITDPQTGVDVSSRHGGVLIAGRNVTHHATNNYSVLYGLNLYGDHPHFHGQTYTTETNDELNLESLALVAWTRSKPGSATFTKTGRGMLIHGGTNSGIYFSSTSLHPSILQGYLTDKNGTTILDNGVFKSGGGKWDDHFEFSSNVRFKVLNPNCIDIDNYKITIGLGAGQTGISTDGVAIGRNAMSGGGVAIGSGAGTTGLHSVAIGHNAFSHQGIRIGGSNDQVEMSEGIWIGTEIKGSDGAGICIGDNTNKEIASIAIGNKLTGGNADVIIGNSAEAGSAGVVIGGSAKGGDAGSMAIGTRANGQGTCSTAIGEGAQAIGHYGAAIGNGAYNPIDYASVISCGDSPRLQLFIIAPDSPQAKNGKASIAYSVDVGGEVLEGRITTLLALFEAAGGTIFTPYY